jgi:transcription termination factor Rho
MSDNTEEKDLPQSAVGTDGESPPARKRAAKKATAKKAAVKKTAAKKVAAKKVAKSAPEPAEAEPMTPPAPKKRASRAKKPADPAPETAPEPQPRESAPESGAEPKRFGRVPGGAQRPENRGRRHARTRAQGLRLPARPRQEFRTGPRRCLRHPGNHPQIQPARRPVDPRLYQEGPRGPQLVEITTVNGMPPEEASKLPHFDELKAINPTRISFETTPERFTTRVVDIMAPSAAASAG